MKESIKKALKFSLQAMLIVSVFGIIWGSVKAGELNFSYVFYMNFLLGTIIIVIGILRMIIPERPGKRGPIDHSNIVEVFLERREEKRAKANSMILSGMLYIVLTAILQFILSFIIP